MERLSLLGLVICRSLELFSVAVTGGADEDVAGVGLGICASDDILTVCFRLEER